MRRMWPGIRKETADHLTSSWILWTDENHQVHTPCLDQETEKRFIQSVRSTRSSCMNGNTHPSSASSQSKYPNQPLENCPIVPDSQRNQWCTRTFLALPAGKSMGPLAANSWQKTFKVWLHGCSESQWTSGKAGTPELVVWWSEMKRSLMVQ